VKELLRLYPRPWRDRYESEVAAMLDESEQGVRDGLDIIRGAIDARRHPDRLGLPTGGIRGWFDRDHMTGLVAALGAVIWIAGLVVIMAQVGRPATWGQRDLRGIAAVAVAAPLLVGAMMMFTARRPGGPIRRLLLAAAVATAACAALVITLSIVSAAVDPGVGLRAVLWEERGLMPYAMGLLPAACVVWALTMWGASSVSRWALLGLGLASLVSVAHLVIWWDSGLVNQLTSGSGVATGLLFSTAWLAVGVSAMRRPTRRPIAPALAPV
jgi:hypothetical protein